MKFLKTIFIYLIISCRITFADYACIYNKTDCDLLVEKVSTGCWLFEQQKLDEKGLRRFDKELKDTECLSETIPANEGFLVRYRHSNKEGSEKTSIVLSSPQKESIDIDITEEGGISQQGVYQITQEYSGPSFGKVDEPNLRKWRHSCDKMVIISNESL